MTAGSRIVAMGHYQPSRVVTNADLANTLDTNDAWIRDCGPTFLINEERQVRGVDWKFNAWGGFEKGLYFPWDADDVVGGKVLDLERVQRYAPDFVMEGGSIDVDGEGTVLTTENPFSGFQTAVALRVNELSRGAGLPPLSTPSFSGKPL